MRKRKGHLFIMTSTLPLKYGGRTNSLLQRARLLTENKSPINNITLLTTNYNANYDDVYKDYRKKGTVNNKINFMNMYDWFKWASKHDSSNSYLDRLKNKFEEDIKNNYLNYLENNFETGMYELKKRKSHPLTYYYKDGIPQYHLSYNTTENRMGHIDVYSGNHTHSAKRLYMNAKGNIHKIRYYKDKRKNNIVRDVFVDEEMDAYLTREYYYSNNIRKLKRDILFKLDGSVEIFKKESERFSYWFNQLFENGDKVVNDVRILDKSLLKVNKNIKRIFQAHGPHLHAPSEPNPEIKKRFARLSKKIEGENDVIITLTEGQKADMLERYPRLENKIKVIPHCIETNKIKVNYNAVIPKKISVVSRLVPLKRIDHTLKAFSEFLKDRPGYTLDIYGYGEDKRSLKKLTEKLKIDSSVYFKGFTTSPHEVFQSSEFTLMTSKFEGLGLTVLESIVNGCPVISYDIKWGPNEIIDDHSGVLVKDGDIQGLKEAMVRVADKPFKRKNVIKINEKYTKKYFLKEWSKLLK